MTPKVHARAEGTLPSRSLASANRPLENYVKFEASLFKLSLAIQKQVKVPPVRSLIQLHRR